MAITRVHGVNDGSSTPASSFATISLSPAGNALITVQFISIDAGGADPGDPGVTGNGITYTEIGRVNISSGVFMQIYRGMAASPSSGAITMDFNGHTQNAVLWDVEWFTGVDTSGTNGSGALGTAQAAVSTGTSQTVTLSALQAGSISFGYMATNDTAGGFTAGSGYTDTFGANNSGSIGSHEGEVNPSGSTTVNYTYSPSSILGLIGFEIKAPTGVTVPQEMPGIIPWPVDIGPRWV